MKVTSLSAHARLVRVSAAAALLICAACNIPDELCNTKEKDNTCSSASDCVVAYCAADCSICQAVYSRRQVENTWCLTPIDESPNSRCREAAESVCTPTSLPTVCPRYIQPLCEDGKCVPDFQPPSDP